MSSSFELERKLELLTDEVKDIFHATSINIDALAVQMEHKNTPNELKATLTSCGTSLK